VTFGPLSELERDVCLLEDVVADALDAWRLASEVPVTPRSCDRVKHVLSRAHAVADQLQELRVAMHNQIIAIERERRRTCTSS